MLHPLELLVEVFTARIAYFFFLIVVSLITGGYILSVTSLGFLVFGLHLLGVLRVQISLHLVVVVAGIWHLIEELHAFL